jgi:hypothetical protein
MEQLHPVFLTFYSGLVGVAAGFPVTSLYRVCPAPEPACSYAAYAARYL